MESKHTKDSSASHLVYRICMTSWQQPASWNSGEKHHCYRLCPVGQPTLHSADSLGSPNWARSPASACCKSPGPLFVSSSADGSNVFSCPLQHGHRPPDLAAKSRWQRTAQFLLHSPRSKATCLAAIPGGAVQAVLPHREQTWHWFAARPGQHTSPQPTTSVLCQWPMRIRRSCLKGDPSCS